MKEKHQPPAVGKVILLMFASLSSLRQAGLAMYIDRTEIHFDIYIY